MALRLSELLLVVVDHLAAIRESLDAQPLHQLGPEALLTTEEVARYLRAHVVDTKRWLEDDGTGRGRARVPRAISPGKRGTVLYHVADVRRALFESRSTDDQQARRDRYRSTG